MLHSSPGSTRLAGTLLVLLVGLSGTVSATTVRGLSLHEKTQIAPTIVQAEVVSVESSWDREGHTAKTSITCRVRESIKGALKVGDQFVIRQAGGTLGDFVHHIPGMSEYRPGEEVILFLEPFKTEHVEIGVGIGKYGIESDARGAKLVTHDPSVALVYTKADGSMSIEDAKPMTPEGLDKFKTRLRNYVSGARAPSGKSGPAKLNPTLTPSPIPGKN